MKLHIKSLLPIITALTVAVTLFLPTKALAVSGSDWRPGNIISDVIFYDNSSMSVQDIQNFLNSKMPNCDTWGTQAYNGSQTRAQYGASRGYPAPYICLKDYSQNGLSAAQIIKNASDSYSINPKTLIVLLQKEQTLVTDDWPWPSQYRSATGYGCPDTAPCDAEYYGLYNQLTNAARQFRRYATYPSEYRYKPYQSNYIQYNPNAGCGGTNVVIENKATAGLYNYTPYQPNASALNNLYGSGDSCGAYGNRNFWRLYSDWFGSMQINTPFAWSYQGQSTFSDSARTSSFTYVPTVAPGGKIYARVKARNIGNQTWSQSFTNLGVSRPIDRASQFTDSSWISNSRATRLLESSVPPGEIGTFEFTIQAPSTTGTYKEYFNPVAEGRAWLNDLGLYFTFNVNTAISAPNSSNTTLEPGQILTKNNRLLSPDSQSALTLQNDGNLVLYSNMITTWNTNALGSSADRLVMQSDGNLVVYNRSNVALWNTQTGGNPGARLVLQTDGNMVVYSASNTVLWATYTIQNPDHLAYVNTSFTSGRMYPGQSLDTANRRLHLVFQPDGNLVLYSPTRALWSTGTDGRQAAFLALQADGNLVLYDRNSSPIWNSGTSGRSNLQLVLQEDGNLVLYNNQFVPIWNTGTSG